jgi:hypothetical protein
VLTLCVVVLGLGASGIWRRVVGAEAVVLTLLVALGSVNQQTLAFPTLGRLLSFDPEHVVSTPELQQIRQQVAATGVLPREGVVLTVAIPSTVSHFATREAYVYLPPAWFAKVTPALPTIVLLPGEPGSAADWSGPGEADDTANAFAAEHHGMARRSQAVSASSSSSFSHGLSQPRVSRGRPLSLRSISSRSASL